MAAQQAQYTEEFFVRLRPDQRAALDEVAAATGRSRSEALRGFIDHGFDIYRRSVAAIDAADPAEVLDALVAAGATHDQIAHAIHERNH
ncbi:MAG TPA: ribbon-helix-helix protein, CopG family [Acidimicrobiales bacterium]|jgi:hypothetical protein|nr:ribbon-helix-helix protein, CopG family [Acidimicrobiales bacterium]